MINFAKDFLNFSYKSPSAFLTIENAVKILDDFGYSKLDIKDSWELKKNQKYYLTINDTSFFAFKTSSKDINETFFKIVGSHTDSPSIKIKPSPEIIENDYLKLNVEIYGGPILNTWLDRPLGISGRVYTKSENAFLPKPHIINVNKPLMIIPNLAIHQNREVNKGVELNRQIDMLPIATLIKEKSEQNNFLIELISKEINVNVSEILDFEIYLHEIDKGSFVGTDSEFLSASRIDNLASVYTSLMALEESENSSYIPIIAAFDNEEIGSETRQGADSLILSNILERIVYSLEGNRKNFLEITSKSFMISADGAHAIHPNKPSLTDPTNHPMLNKGPVIKLSSNFRYTTDSYTGSIIRQIAEEKEINYQYFVNRSDLQGGSTIGPASSKYLPIPSIDLGIPMLSMHSIRELCGIEDLFTLKNLLKEFYNY